MKNSQESTGRQSRTDEKPLRNLPENGVYAGRKMDLAFQMWQLFTIVAVKKLIEHRTSHLEKNATLTDHLDGNLVRRIQADSFREL